MTAASTNRWQAMDPAAWAAVALVMTQFVAFGLLEPSFALGLSLSVAPVLPIAVRLATLTPDHAAEPVGSARGAACGPLSRRLQLRLVGAAIWAASTMILADWVPEVLPLTPGGHLAFVALVPIPAFVYFIAIEVQALLNMDELFRKMQLEALAIAFPTAIVAGVMIGWVQEAGFLSGMTIEDFWPLLFLFYVIGYSVAWVRYR